MVSARVIQSKDLGLSHRMGGPLGSDPTIRGALINCSHNDRARASIAERRYSIVRVVGARLVMSHAFPRGSKVTR